MSVDLAHPAPHTSPEESLRITQLAPKYISRSQSKLPFPLSVFSRDDSATVWSSYETLFLECIRTGDDASARKILDRLINRFGENNERVMAFQGMWEEVNAKDGKALDEVLKIYGEILEKEPTNIPVQKRRIALLRSVNRIPEAIAKLVALLDMSPTDAEAWSELADLYTQQGMLEQAIFCLEETLLAQPNAWNVHALIAETIYSTADPTSQNALELSRIYAEALRRYLRSVELCDNYLRAYYGLYLTTTAILPLIPAASKEHSKDTSYTDLALPTEGTVKALRELATEKLTEIVRKGTAEEKGWDGYDKAELQAAKELLAGQEQNVTR